MKFETYAVSRIKGSIIDELRSLDWVPRSVRARSREIERKATELEHRLQRAPTDEELAAALGMEMEEFQARDHPDLQLVDRRARRDVERLLRRRAAVAHRHDRRLAPDQPAATCST